nr:MAG TPA: hypothetical protein [Caudoviricetes sp.]DAW07176.1 MAG TPA: hypothetical protein [Caudoviricetes sp.]
MEINLYVHFHTLFYHYNKLLIYVDFHSILLLLQGVQCIQQQLYHNSFQSSRIACKRT